MTRFLTIIRFFNLVILRYSCYHQIDFFLYQGRTKCARNEGSVHFLTCFIVFSRSRSLRWPTKKIIHRRFLFLTQKLWYLYGFLYQIEGIQCLIYINIYIVGLFNHLQYFFSIKNKINNLWSSFCKDGAGMVTEIGNFRWIRSSNFIRCLA